MLFWLVLQDLLILTATWIDWVRPNPVHEWDEDHLIYMAMVPEQKIIIHECKRLLFDLHFPSALSANQCFFSC